MSYHAPNTIKKSVMKMHNDSNNYNKLAQSMHSYFDVKEQQKGDKWLDAVDQKKMSKECKQIIRDLINRNINLELHSHYFLEYLVLESVLREADVQFRRNYCDVQVYDYYLKACDDRHIIPHMDYMARYDEAVKCTSLYQHILECMWNIKNSKEPMVHLSNLYEWLSITGAKANYTNDVADMLRENSEDNI